MINKNIILNIVFGFIITQTIAQLSVRNSAYIYVTDEVLYVTDDVNIEDTTANIYLRDEAQLIQGEPTVPTGNSGIGKLSVYQEGTVNEFAYNYWSSPVGNIGSNDNNNRGFIPNQQFYDFIGDPDPILNPITSNLAGFTSAFDGTSSPLVISDKWLYSYDPGILYSEWDYLGTSGTLEPGYGFSMKGTIGSGSNQLYDFRGKPNNGTIQVDIEDGLQTLVGNPYPSALDSYLFIHDSQNAGLLDVSNPSGMSGALYYWEQTPTNHVLTSYLGGYATYTNYQVSDNGTPTDLTDDIVMDSFTPAPFSLYDANGNPLGFPTGVGTNVAFRYIPIGQGFMIEGAAGIPASTTVYFKNSHRTFYREAGADSYFFRTNNQEITNAQEQIYNDQGLNIIPSDFKRFRLNVGFNNLEAYSRQLLLNFHSSATDGFDYGLEAKGNEMLNSDAHWTLNGTPYVIQAFNFAPDLVIPLVVNTEQQQPVLFRIVDIQNFDNNQPIYIHDIDANLYVDLRIQDYSINLDQGSYPNRFEIVFTANTLDVNEFTFESFDIYQNNENSELTIFNPKGLNLKSVALYDVSGKQVYGHMNLNNTVKQTFKTQNLSEGIYVAKVDIKGFDTYSKKVVITKNTN